MVVTQNFTNPVAIPPLIDIAAATNGGAQVRLQIRPTGSDDHAWSDQPIVDFGDTLRFAANTLAAGDYEWDRVLTSMPGSTANVTSNGRFTLNPALAMIVIDERTPGIFSWDNLPAGGTQEWRYRLAGSNDAWSVLSIDTHSTRSQVDVRTWANQGSRAGHYDYELLWTDANASSTLAPTAANRGQFNVQSARRPTMVVTVSLPNITEITARTGLSAV